MDNQRAMKLKTMPYDEYLKTEEWAEKRGWVLERDGHRCRLCNSKEPLHVHHRTYARRGAEDLEDLTTLCKICHEHFHQRVQQDTLMEATYTRPVESREVIAQRWEDYAIGVLLQNPSLFPHVNGIIAESDFIGKDTHALYLLVKSNSKVDQPLDIPSDLQATASRVIALVLANGNPLGGDRDFVKEAIQSITRVKIANLSRSNHELDLQIRATTTSGDQEALMEALQKKQQNSMLLRTIYSVMRLQS